MITLVSWWSLEHAGCIAPDGSQYTAPDSMESLCSHAWTLTSWAGVATIAQPAWVAIQGVLRSCRGSGKAMQDLQLSKATSQCRSAHGRNVRLLGYCSN